MTTVTIDQETLAKFGNLTACLEIRDESGRVLGYFTPLVERSMYDGVDSPVPPDELERRESQAGGRPLHESLVDLKKRETK